MIPDQVFYDFAIRLHDKTCKAAHEDHCSWFYEINRGVHDWKGWAHRDALQRATKQLEKARMVISLYFPLANDLSPESLCNLALEIA